MILRRDFLLLLAGLLAVPASPAFAEDGGSDDGGGDDGGGEDGGDDDGGGGNGGAERARDAVRKGRAASLGEILKLVRQRYPGEVIHVGVTGGANNLVYEIQLLDSLNRRLQVRVSASQRKIIGAEFH